MDAPVGTEYMFREKALGKDAITEIFDRITPEWTKAQLFMGHLRYSTTGKSGLQYVHPFLRRNNWRAKNLCLCGNLAAIFASGLYELAGYVQTDEARRYIEIADKILSSLQENYQPEPQTAQGFLLLHSTGNYPAKDEIDVPINYADYYYLEALLRRATMR